MDDVTLSVSVLMYKERLPSYILAVRNLDVSQGNLAGGLVFKMCTLFIPATPLLCFCPGEGHVEMHTEEYTRMFNTTLFVFMENWKQHHIQTMIQA